MDSEGVKKYFHLKKDLLECPVCYQTIDSVPIYQCRNGHVVCKNCHPRLRTCPTCRDGPISQRNRKLEEIVESVTQNEIKTIDCCCGCYCCRIYNKCGCFGIRMGAKVILILSLIFDVLLLINNVSTDVNLSDRLTMQFFNDPSRFVSGHEINPVLVVSIIIINLILIALDVFAIIGISLKKPGFMVGWLIVHMIALVLFRIASFVMTIMTLFITGGALIEVFTCYSGSFDCRRDTAVFVFIGKFYIIYYLGIIGILVALNWLGYYFWNIVRSAIVELEQEDGLWYAFEFQLCNFAMCFHR